MVFKFIIQCNRFCKYNQKRIIKQRIDKERGCGGGRYHTSASPVRLSVSAAAEDAQQEEEEVDEVEIEVHGAHGGEFVAHGRFGVHTRQLLHALRIPGRKTQKQQHADDGNPPLHGVGSHEDVHHAGNDEAEEAEHAEGANLGEVSFGEIAVERHGAEGAGGDEEHVRDGADLVNQEDRQKSPNTRPDDIRSMRAGIMKAITSMPIQMPK